MSAAPTSSSSSSCNLTYILLKKFIKYDLKVSNESVECKIFSKYLKLSIAILQTR